MAVPYWKPDTFENLHNLICEVYTTPSEANLQELKADLDRFQQEFINLLDDLPKNSDHRCNLKKGKPLINNVTHNVNDQFVNEAINLSDELNVNEYYAATLLQFGMQLRSRFDRSAAETAILLYHSERIYLLNCLNLIMKGAYDEGLATEVRTLFEEYTTTLVFSTVKKQNSTSSLTYAQKILETIESLKTNVALLKEHGSMSGNNNAQKTISLSEDCIKERVEKFSDERKELAHILFLISYQRQLDSAEIMAIAENLYKANLTDSISYYLIPTLLASIDSAPEHILAFGVEQQRYTSNSSNIDFLKKFNTLINKNDWASQPLKGVILLQWSLYLSSLFTKSPSLEQQLGFAEDKIEHMAENAISLNAFTFLKEKILCFKDEVKVIQMSSENSAMTGVTFASITSEINAANSREISDTPEIDEDFQWYILHQLDLMVTSFISTLSGVLRRLKNREDDVTYTSRGPSEQPPRKDLQMFFELVSSIYKDRTDAGLKFWEGPDDRLFAFLKWAADCKASELVRAAFDMFASLATGPKSSQYAYDFLNSGGGRHPNLMQSSNHTTNLCSWNALFGALEFYSTNLVPTQTVSSGMTPPAQIQPEEVILLKSFLRLLRQIVKYSSIARTTLYENQQYKPMNTLFNLLRCPVPTDLKAALLETIAAFCSPISSNGPQIARQTWVTLEQSQLLQTIRSTTSQNGSQFPAVEGGQFTNVRNLGQSGFGPGAGARKEGEGIRTELEEIESAKETYPETLAFLHLLNTLIYTPGKNSAYRSGFGIVSPTIPDNLGSGYRAPGINPYINFVLDHVLLKAHNRSYINPEEKWAVIEASLKLVEKCLITFDIKSILIESVVPGPSGEDLSKSVATMNNSTTSQAQAAFSLATHPGFEIMARILCGSKLLEEICRILAFGVDAVNQNTFKTPAFRLCVLHSLRILLRVMQIQDIFLSVLVPIIVESNNSTTFGTKISLPPALVSVDQLLLYRKDVIVQIALFVNCFESDEICLLSVKALLALSESEAFGGRGHNDGDFSINKLVSVLNSSDEAARILHGFLERLEIDEPEVDTVETGITQHDNMYQVMSESSGGLDDQPGMANSIRLRILELLLKNLNPDKVPPTISHMLLGYQLKGGISETEIPDPMSDNAKVSCLHIILDLLREGIERSKGNSESDQSKETSVQRSGVPLFIKHPSLAERCYHLIYRLCSNPNTSSPTMRYLRIREDYYYSQLKAMPITIGQIGEQHNGEAIYHDGTKVALDIAGLFAQLHQRAWLMRTIALELHITTLAGQRSQTQRLLNLLYGTGESIIADDTVSEDRFDISGISTLSKSKLQQTTMKMLEILNSVDFVWNDYLKNDALEPFYFKSLNFEPCLRTNERGCYVYDIRAVFAMLSVAKKQFEKQGSISSAGQKSAIKEEMRLILNHFIVENRSRELFHAKFHCLQAWKQVVDITLSKCFDLLTPESRESVLYDLILSLLPKIISEDNTILIAESLSGVVLSLLTKLRQDQQHQIVLQTPSTLGSTTVAVRLPADRLHSILKGLIESIQRPGSTITMRGNLYVALLSYLQYTNPSNNSINQVKKDLEQPLSSSAFGRSLSSSLSATSRPVQRDNLEAGNLSILNIAGDKFLEILCRDACDSDDVWKTVAFTLLDSLTLLWEREKVNQVTNYMLRRNFLRHFVEMLRRDDIALQELLQPEVDDLNALFVYESKLSLFLRIAQRRDGAEKLLESGVVEVLSDIGFLDQRPNSDAMNTDFDSFIPPATERYHQLLTPLLQLLVAILTILGRDHTTAINKISNFVRRHQEVFAAVLQDTSAVISLTTLSELRLITALFSYLSSQQDLVDKMRTGLGFGSFQTLTLGLLSKYSSTDRWSYKLKPANDIEREKEQQTYRFMGASLEISLLQREAEFVVQEIWKNILTYCQVLTDTERGNKIFKPIFGWTLTAAKDGDYYVAAPGTSSTPTLATLAIYMRSTINSLLKQLKDHKDISYKINNVTSLTMGEVNDILSGSPSDFADDLTSGQRQQLALNELQRTLNSKSKEIASSLYIIENGLLLLWRHLEFYLTVYTPSYEADLSSSRGYISSPQAFGRSQTNFDGSTGKNRGFQPAASDLDVLRTDASIVLQPVLNKLLSLELTQNIVGNANTRNSYLQMLVRRIKDLLVQSEEEW